MFEGPAILRKMQKYGLIGEEEKELDFVLQLSTGKVRVHRKGTSNSKTQITPKKKESGPS